MAPSLEYVFTLHVDLSPPLDFGNTFCGHRRFIPITGGRVDGPELKAIILPGGGDWNAIREDGMGHMLAEYAIKTEDGVLINATNEGYVRKFQKDSSTATESNPASQSTKREETKWYAKTNPRFEVEDGPHGWLNRTVFIGNLLRPERLGHVTIDVYAVE